jgi:predicted glycoside hydrolase/deacetylase ChbG (UPF0249 family)
VLACRRDSAGGTHLTLARSTPTRRLIVNADDFGASPEINAAVIRAHREGILTSASLMVGGAAFEEAVALAREHPTLGIGLHLTLVCGRPVLPPQQIPGLVRAAARPLAKPTPTDSPTPSPSPRPSPAGRGGNCGSFSQTVNVSRATERDALLPLPAGEGRGEGERPGSASGPQTTSHTPETSATRTAISSPQEPARLLSPPLSSIRNGGVGARRAGEEERFFDSNPTRAGLRWFFRRSLRPQLEAEIRAQFERFAATGLRLDHVNGHLNTHLHPVVLGILLEHARAWGIRHLRLTRDPFRLNARLAGGAWGYRLSHALIFRALSAWARPRLARAGIGFTDRVFGLLQNGRVDEAFLLKLIAQLPPGDSELYSHPSTGEVRHELTALVSPPVRRAIATGGIQLIRHQDLRP